MYVNISLVFSFYILVVDISSKMSREFIISFNWPFTALIARYIVIALLHCIAPLTTFEICVNDT